MGLISLSALLPFTSLRSVTVGSGRSGGLLFSVCKGKQLYSESNRFSGYWSNKFRKHHCNYLFYREISKSSLPRPSEGRGCAYAHTRDKGQGSLSDSFLQNTCELALPSLRRGWGGCRGGFFIPNHTITITKSQKGFSMCKKGCLYNIIPY